jgi:hypothetical protein
VLLPAPVPLPPLDVPVLLATAVPVELPAAAEPVDVCEVVRPVELTAPAEDAAELPPVVDPSLV